MMQCTKHESGARLVDPRIMEQKTNFCCPGYIFYFAQPFSPKILSYVSLTAKVAGIQIVRVSGSCVK